MGRTKRLIYHKVYKGRGERKGMNTTQPYNAKPLWTCPRCKNKTYDYPALSRKDNSTEICSACGTDEAMIDFIGRKK